jgi:hypothetical protein
MLNLIENEGVEEDGYMRDDFAREGARRMLMSASLWCG